MGGGGGQKRPKNGPHGLCMTPSVHTYVPIVNKLVGNIDGQARTSHDSQLFKFLQFILSKNILETVIIHTSGLITSV